jgi:hypothetical protein
MFNGHGSLSTVHNAPRHSVTSLSSLSNKHQLQKLHKRSRRSMPSGTWKTQRAPKAPTRLSTPSPVHFAHLVHQCVQPICAVRSILGILSLPCSRVGVITFCLRLPYGCRLALVLDVLIQGLSGTHPSSFSLSLSEMSTKAPSSQMRPHLAASLLLHPLLHLAHPPQSQAPAASNSPGPFS